MNRDPDAHHPLPARAHAALAAGRLGGALSRRFGRGAGGVIGGNVALRLYPAALEALARGRDVALVSGTNGKTTTTELLATALASLGPVACNRDGSNMANGLVVALDAARHASLASLEVDEAYLGPIIAATRPRTVTLINLNREFTRGVSYKREAHHWRESLPLVGDDCTIVANADDPLVVWSVGSASRVVWVAGDLFWRDDALTCRGCLRPLQWDGVDYRCESCGLHRPTPAWWLEGDVIRSLHDSYTLSVRLPGRVNRVNALFALATAASYGVDIPTAMSAMAEVVHVDGRYRLYEVDGRTVQLHMVKNSAGWNEIFDHVVSERGAGTVFAIDDFGLTGRDTATIWDAPAELLAGRRVVASGGRRNDIASRLEVAGADAITVPDHVDAIRAFPSGPVNVVANYSAFNLLKRRLG